MINEGGVSMRRALPRISRSAPFPLLALLLIAGCAQINSTAPAGRWEIVNTSGDNASQSQFGPGGFSVFLKTDGSSYVPGTITNSNCVPNASGTNVIPSWMAVGGSKYQIFVAINNAGMPPLAFSYTGTYNPRTPVSGDGTKFIAAISGTYYPLGDASLCSTATQSNPGTFVATFVPALSSGSASGSLAGADANNTMAFDSPVNAAINFSAPPTPGQSSGTVTLSSNPTFHGVSCFAATNGVMNPLTIDPVSSSQSGLIDSMIANGIDPTGQPTTLFLTGFSSNFYSTNNNTDPFAFQLTDGEWAVGAAIAEDNPAMAPGGVENDGTNNDIAVFYSVIGGACDGANGSSLASPFKYSSTSSTLP